VGRALPIDRAPKYVVSSTLKKAEGTFNTYQKAMLSRRSPSWKQQPVDVAAAGSWIGTVTLVRCYQQADEATMLAVVMSAGQLREQQAKKVTCLHTVFAQARVNNWEQKS
jgi:hypothetical protein